jgi:hypothetical protein
MIRRQLHRPSLKITRNTDQGGVHNFAFEVWSPFTGDYQAECSMGAAMRRVDQLAGLIRQMRLQRHAKQDALADAPDADRANIGMWAEFRINPTTYRSYDTRRFDKPSWTRVSSLIQAIETTCVMVGCEPAPSGSAKKGADQAA